MLKSKHKLYPIWNAQKQRCNNVNNIDYPRYGGRGIKLSTEFDRDFFTWLKYVVSLPNYGKSTYSLDRKNNDKGYQKDNLRWVSKFTQASNQAMQVNNSSGFKGVFLNRKRWRATITVNKKRVSLGTYDSAFTASLAYDQYIIDNSLPHITNGTLI